MKKFLHISYVVFMRIFLFILLVLASPLWILFGLFIAGSVLFGQADDFIDPDYYDDKRKEAEECPEYVERENQEEIDNLEEMDKLEDDTEVHTDN